MRILYVEDDPVDHELTLRYLERHAPQLEMITVGTVEKALDRLGAGDIDLVLSDYRLPDGTGLEFLEAVTRRGIDVPIVLVTGSGSVEVGVQLLKAGAADYVVKQANYLATLPRIVEGAFRWFQAMREARRSTLRVLYAEHDPADAELTRRAFAEEGPHFRVDVVGRGHEALRMLESVPFDILLLDYRLPDLSGIELLKVLREKSIRLPVVMVTGQGDEATAVQAFKLGVADYIVKNPGYLAKLPSTLEHALAHQRSSDEKDVLMRQLQSQAVELQRAKLAAEEASRVKSQFLANMSHELRTPLNSIIGFSKVLLNRLDGDISPRQESYVTTIYDSSVHLLRLINTLLDISRIEAGKVDLHYEDIDVAALVEECLAASRPLVGGKPVALQADFVPDVPRLSADRTKIKQVLLNLLSNAIKFTSSGHVRVRVSRAAEALHLSVVDTGTGVDPNDLPQLFMPFQRSHQPQARESAGAGLGLAITKGLVELHGGQIWVERGQPRGTEMHVTLPLRP